MAKRPSRRQSKRSCLIVVLAAGEGTRMRSSRPKVMHPVGGLPMLGHVLQAATAAGADAIAVVIGPGADAVRAFVGKAAPGATVHEQRQRLGTAHAVRAAQAAIKPGFDDVLVLYGDTPLLTAATLKRLRRSLAGGADVAVLGFEPPDPAGYGRLIVEKGQLTAIREAKDASAGELKIGLCNAGIMGFSGAGLLPLLRKIGNNNAKGEFYLTDAVGLAHRGGRKVTAITGAAEEVVGVNDRHDLAAVEAIWQARARAAAMRGGATLIDPDSVYFSHDTRLGRDVLVEPGVFFGPGVTVADGAHIKAFSHIDTAQIGRGATIGPFARLRPGAAIGADARVGNFVEVKEADIGAGAKVSHLTYVGDATIGANANIGAGTITCNYDGVSKYRTEIGAEAFVGSNTALVAPVTVGKGAYVASGSVITKDVPDGSLAIGRARQVQKPGWTARLRAATKKKPE